MSGGSGEVAVTKVFNNGKVTVPAEVRRMLGIVDGDRLVWYVNERGEACVRVARRQHFVGL